MRAVSYHGMIARSLSRQQTVNLASCAHCGICYAFILRLEEELHRHRARKILAETRGHEENPGRGIEGIRRSVMCTLKRKLKLRQSRY